MSCAGVVKSYNDIKGWGFITYEGQDVFMHVKDCTDGRPVSGDYVTFDMQEDNVRGQGQTTAMNISGCTGTSDGKGKGKDKGKGKGKGGCKGVLGNGAYQGMCKSFNDMKGWGFIEYEGQDIFLHVKDCAGCRPIQGDWLAFDIEEDNVRAGQKKAINVTGGSGSESGGPMKGKGKGGGFGPMWGMDPWSMGGMGGGMGGCPYGKGAMGGGWGGPMMGGWGGGMMGGGMKGMMGGGMKGGKGYGKAIGW